MKYLKYIQFKRQLFLPLLLLIFLIPVTAFTQKTKIMYVEPGYQTGPKYDKIREAITNGLRDGLQEKWVRRITSTTWERFPNKSKLLEDNKVNYVLKLNKLPVIKSTDREIKISFELIYVDESFNTISREWISSLYVLALNDRKEPANVQKLVNDVCDEIDFYINSSADPLARRFRPRFKIDGFTVRTTDVEDIDLNSFGKWLNKILKDKYAVDSPYVFYYNRKYDKQYPESSMYQITGTFSKYADSDDKLVRIELILELPDDALDVDPAIIHSEEFKYDEKRRDELVNNIISVLDKIE